MEKITDRMKIHHGDCYELLDSFPSDAALITDPPYGIAYCHGGRKGGRLMGTDGMSIVGDNHPFDPRPFLRFATVCLWGPTTSRHACQTRERGLCGTSGTESPATIKPTANWRGQTANAWRG